MKINSKTYETKKEKRRDFLIGFGGWFAVNILLYISQAIILNLLNSLFDLGTNTPGAQIRAAFLCFGSIPLLINIAGLIYLGFTRKWVAFGALAAIGVVLLLVLCFITACFYLLSVSYS